MPSDKGWIGVDLDGTLFTYDTWLGWNVFGEPIKPMVDRVRSWIAEGKQVRIFTARIGLPFLVLEEGMLVYSTFRGYTCRVTGEPFSDAHMLRAVQDHLTRHGLPRLAVQCYKDVHMIELWDDRAVQVIPNKGITLTDAHEVEMMALRGKSFQGRVEEHPSHNVSSSFFTCYGCGLPAGHVDLQKPCPTPDMVGKMRMSR